MTLVGGTHSAEYPMINGREDKSFKSAEGSLAVFEVHPAARIGAFLLAGPLCPIDENIALAGESLTAAPYEEEILVTDAKYAELRLIAAGFEPEERAWWFETLRDAGFESVARAFSAAAGAGASIGVRCRTWTGPVASFNNPLEKYPLRFSEYTPRFSEYTLRFSEYTPRFSEHTIHP